MNNNEVEKTTAQDFNYVLAEFYEIISENDEWVENVPSPFIYRIKHNDYFSTVVEDFRYFVEMINAYKALLGANEFDRCEELIDSLEDKLKIPLYGYYNEISRLREIHRLRIENQQLRESMKQVD